MEAGAARHVTARAASIFPLGLRPRGLTPGVIDSLDEGARGRCPRTPVHESMLPEEPSLHECVSYRSCRDR